MLFSQDKQSLWWRKECTAILANWKYFKECKALKECKKCIKSYYSRVEPGSVHLNTEIGLSMITYLPWSWYMDLIWPIWHMLCYAKSLQSCSTLCDPIDSSPPGYPIPGSLQARTLEWAAISFSNAWKWKVKVKSLSRVRLLATPWTAAYQAPPSMGFSRQEYWSGVPLPSPGYVYMYNWITFLYTWNTL